MEYFKIPYYSLDPDIHYYVHKSVAESWAGMVKAHILATNFFFMM